MRKYLLILVILIAFSGCGTMAKYMVPQTIYTHPTKNASDFKKDLYDCDLIAAEYVANQGYPGNPIIEVREQKRCLEQKYGWSVCQKDCKASV